MRAAMQKTMGSMGTLFPFGNMEEVGRQNMAMIERAFSLFTPFYRGTDPATEAAQEIESLKAEVATLRQELAAARAKAEPNK
jgi:polyhydroxyalkanoate synthesis regulator protein